MRGCLSACVSEMFSIGVEWNETNGTFFFVHVTTVQNKLHNGSKDRNAFVFECDELWTRIINSAHTHTHIIEK